MLKIHLRARKTSMIYTKNLYFDSNRLNRNERFNCKTFHIRYQLISRSVKPLQWAYPLNQIDRTFKSSRHTQALGNFLRHTIITFGYHHFMQRYDVIRTTMKTRLQL